MASALILRGLVVRSLRCLREGFEIDAELDEPLFVTVADDPLHLSSPSLLRWSLRFLWLQLHLSLRHLLVG